LIARSQVSALPGWPSVAGSITTPAVFIALPWHVPQYLRSVSGPLSDSVHEGPGIEAWLKAGQSRFGSALVLLSRDR